MRSHFEVAVANHRHANDATATHAKDAALGRGVMIKRNSPYTMGDPCGSSSGSAISVAANMAAVSLGTETDGSILCPSNNNLVVGIKPTVGLTSRAGVIPISPRQDSVGTVANVVYVIDALVGIDHYDNAAIETSWYIPKGGYAQAQFLKINGLHAKRVGIGSEPKLIEIAYGFEQETNNRKPPKLKT
ncbi:putative amidase [Quercus suber]|uniref:Amidase n=1 Tax=Quercus suber TaxID=58331 RepID=A0AAW0KG90_QUESU